MMVKKLPIPHNKPKITRCLGIMGLFQAFALTTINQIPGNPIDTRYIEGLATPRWMITDRIISEEIAYSRAK